MDYRSHHTSNMLHHCLVKPWYSETDLISRPKYEVYKMLSAIKKTSPGVDGVPYWVYKHCAIELAPVLTHLINKIVKNGNPLQCGLKLLSLL